MSHALPKTYKRWMWPGAATGIDGLQLMEEPLPLPGEGEVLVQIHAVSLNYREIPTGLTPGCDPAGKIVAVSSSAAARGWRIGDRVTVPIMTADYGGPMQPSFTSSAMGGGSQGTLMEYRVFPSMALARIPNSITWEHAATFSCAGETVVALGTGSVAIFGAQIALASGARVIMTSSSDDKLVEVEKLLGSRIINYKTESNWHERILELTDGRGADHILNTGGGSSLPLCLKAIAFGGCVSKHDKPARARHTSIAIIRGVLCGTLEQLRGLLRLFDICSIKPVIGKVFGFEETKEALKTLEHQSFLGKIVVRVQ
ncbi:NAD(P)-binding protein [Auriculariales sp. MPI-PUGE-AT-0066]|nr:NAD(P)-binding protein [Auriculariales sp. MPI-PUGE-AT-0066]